RRAGEVANASGKDRNTGENHGAGDDGANPVERPDSRNRERQRQRVIQHEAEQKSGEKKERRSSDDAWGSGAVHWVPSRVHCHVGSRRWWGFEARSHPERQLRGHPKNLQQGCQPEKLLQNVQRKGTEAMGSARHRTEVGPRTEAGTIVESKAEAVAELMLEVAQCFFRIRALGQKAGLITSWGGGAFGFMRSLALLGPLTVPQIAQM